MKLSLNAYITCMCCMYVGNLCAAIVVEIEDFLCVFFLHYLWFNFLPMQKKNEYICICMQHWLIFNPDLKLKVECFSFFCNCFCGTQNMFKQIQMQQQKIYCKRHDQIRHFFFCCVLCFR